MMFPFTKKKKEYTGLFIDNSIYRYISLAGDPGNFEVVCSAGGSIYSGHGSAPEVCGDPCECFRTALEHVVRDTGKIKNPVNMSLPAADSLIRIIPMSDMEIAEAKLAFRYDYERYFPFPRDEAVFDMTPVVYPLPDGSEERRFLAASARRVLIENMMDAAAAHGIEIAAMEPAQIALERAATPVVPFCNSAVYVYAGRRHSVIILSWKGNGLFYRSISEGFGRCLPAGTGIHNVDVQGNLFVKEVHSSIHFGLSQISGFEPEAIFLFGPGASEGLCNLMKESTDIPSVAMVDPLSMHGIMFSDEKLRLGSWDIPVGLALGQL